MLIDLIILFVVKSDLYLQRRCVGCIPLFTFLDGILRVFLAQCKVYEFQAQIAAVVCNRRDVIEHLFESFIQKPLVGILLDFDKIGHFQNLFLSGIVHSHTLPGSNWTDSIFLH